jgi:hypothetical protein
MSTTSSGIPGTKKVNLPKVNALSQTNPNTELLAAQLIVSQEKIGGAAQGAFLVVHREVFQVGDEHDIFRNTRDKDRWQVW